MNGKYNMHDYTSFDAPGDMDIDDEMDIASQTDDVMANLMGNLLKAQNVARMWHWKVKSFAMHMALGELYDGLSEIMDDLMEMYMGRYGTEAHIPMSEPNPFSERDPLEFIRQLDSFLDDQEQRIAQDGFIVNTFQELQGMVSKIKYKLENLS